MTVWFDANSVVNNYLFKFNNRNSTKRGKICSELTKKTPERSHWCRSGVFVVNFEHFSTVSIIDFEQVIICLERRHIKTVDITNSKHCSEKCQRILRKTPALRSFLVNDFTNKGLLQSYFSVNFENNVTREHRWAAAFISRTKNLSSSELIRKIQCRALRILKVH